MYNLTNISEPLTYADFMREANVLTDGFYGAAFILVLYFVLFILMRADDSKSALLVTSFIVTIISGLLVFVGIVNFTSVIVSGIVMAIMIFVRVWSSE